MTKWRGLQSNIATWIKDKPESGLPLSASEARWLYDEFGDYQFLHMSADTQDSDFETAKDDLLVSTTRHVPQPRYWTRRIKTPGVYNIESLRVVSELTRPVMSGIDFRVIGAYDSIDLERPPAEWEGGRPLPARSRVAVYNATLEVEILRKMMPCTRYQFTTRANVQQALLTSIDLSVLMNATSKENLLELLGTEFYRILMSVYQRENTLIKNKRELYYMIYNATYGLIRSLQNQLAAVIEKMDMAFPIPVHRRIEAMGSLKGIIHRVVSDINMNRFSGDLVQTVCT